MLMPDPSIVARVEAIDNWFADCTRAGPASAGEHILWVENWDEAARWYSGWPWRNTVIEAANAIRHVLHKRHVNEYCEWNRISGEAKKVLDRLVYPLARDFAKKHGLEDRFVECVGWDIGGALIESAYLKFRPPLFFIPRILPIYEAGHYPCGWDGEWPDGRLVVI